MPSLARWLVLRLRRGRGPEQALRARADLDPIMKDRDDLGRLVQPHPPSPQQQLRLFSSRC